MTPCSVCHVNKAIWHCAKKNVLVCSDCNYGHKLCQSTHIKIAQFTSMSMLYWSAACGIIMYILFALAVHKGLVK